MGNLLRHGIEMYKQTINNDAPLPDEPKSTGNFLKSGKILNDQLTMPASKILLKETQPSAKDSKFRRVAKFLILIGSEQASGILSELDQDQVSEITKEISLIKTISPEERDVIFTEFHALFSGAKLQPYRLNGFPAGGIETARRILYAAKGAQKGEALLNKAVPESKESPFTFLEEFSPEQLIMLFKNESAQTIALILVRLSAKTSAGIINKLPPKLKPDVLKRMAHQGEVMPEVLEQVSAAFKEKVRHISGGAKDVEIDGIQTLAAILKQGEYSFGDRLINELEMEDPKIGKDLKDKLYTLDDVVKTVERPIQEKLKLMTERDIAVLIKGRGKEFSEKILSCVSEGRRKIIQEEFDILGPVPKRDCDAAAKDFLAWFRLARERGEIILYSDEDVYI